VAHLGREGRLPRREGGLQRATIVRADAFAGGIGHAPPLTVAQGVPVVDVENHGKAVGERRIERFRPEILLAGRLVGRARVHRRPPVAQVRQRQTLDLALVDEREETVLVFGLAAADLVDKHRLGAPHRRGRLEEADRGLRVVGVGEPDEVVERDQAGVVVPVLEPERLADGVEQKGFPRAAAADEEHRVAAREDGEDDGFLRLEAVGAEGREAAAGWRVGHAVPHRSWQDHRLGAGW
jgi:hypothetical protein